VREGVGGCGCGRVREGAGGTTTALEQTRQNFAVFLSFHRTITCGTSHLPHHNSMFHQYLAFPAPPHVQCIRQFFLFLINCLLLCFNFRCNWDSQATDMKTFLHLLFSLGLPHLHGIGCGQNEVFIRKGGVRVCVQNRVSFALLFPDWSRPLWRGGRWEGCILHVHATFLCRLAPTLLHSYVSTPAHLHRARCFNLGSKNIRGFCCGFTITPSMPASSSQFQNTGKQSVAPSFALCLLEKMHW